MVPIQQVSLFSQNSIKTMTLDIAGNLLLGTDNGLYIYNEKPTSRCISYTTPGTPLH